MLRALWRLLSGPYFLSFCENVVSLAQGVSDRFCMFSFLSTFSHFPFPISVPDALGWISARC